ncbi:hypothetical protein [Viscerimonas tarda]
MELLKRKARIMLVMLFVAGSISAQTGTTTPPPVLPDDPIVYVGFGAGLDYGGLGAKIEYFPIKYLSVFGGLGFNMALVGWNVGLGCLPLPNKKVSPKLTAMYGYNGVLARGEGILDSNVEKISRGITVGMGISIRVGRGGNRLDMSLLVPFRSSEFMDKYHEWENNSSMKVSQLLPVAFSIGYNFN